MFKKTVKFLPKLGYRPKKLIFGDGYKGFDEAAPYDAIIVTAGAPFVPKPLLKQLSIGGRLIIPVGDKEQIMQVFLQGRVKNSMKKKRWATTEFVPLLENKN